MQCVVMELDRSRGFTGYSRYGILKGKVQEVVVKNSLQAWNGVYLEVTGTFHLERSGGMMAQACQERTERYPVQAWKVLEGMPLTLTNQELKRLCKEFLTTP